MISRNDSQWVVAGNRLRESCRCTLQQTTMRLHILSDLHLEFGITELPTTDADVVVLAGDIHVGTEGLKWIQRQFPEQQVIYVLGNHEFYRHSIPELTETLKRETSGSHIHVLENEAVVIDGFTFLGCTLWTDFQLWPDPQAAMLIAQRGISDFTVIEVKSENRVLHPQDTVRLNAESVAWLKSELAKHDHARTIVVTHHAPSPRSIPPIHAGNVLNAAFVCDLGTLIVESRIPLWIHGHTHFNVDYEAGTTRILSNQRGYPQAPTAGFDPQLVVKA
jgi:predicted phosphohydrolase